MIPTAKMLPLILLLALFQSAVSDLRIDPLVHTNVGLITGLRATDGDYSMFLGIPYAIVDKGNPFGASLPCPPFEGTFQAYDDSALCPQRDDISQSITGTLDCLQLNVFVPDSASSQNRLPVLVFIHGGFLQRGSFSRTTYGPKFLVKHDIILITLNYRVGPYGFMCLDTPEIPGNEGLKDQIKALKWIKDNIEAFGGDPTQVTLSGQSAGAASVDFHLMYPGERLFNKVILQSGVALTPARVIESDSTKPFTLAAYFGYATDDLKEALAFLATINTNSIIEATLELNIEFKVCVEKHFDGVEIFVPQHPGNAGRPLVTDVPVLIGSVNKELMTTHYNRDSEYYQNLNIFMDLEDVFEFNENIVTVHDNVRNFYIGDHVMTEDDQWKILDFASDFTYVHPIQRGMRKYIQSAAKEIYFYIFTYEGGRNFAKYRNNILDAPGAWHSDDLGYLFDSSLIIEEPTPEDQDIIDKMTTMWTNFVKYGNPTPTTSELLPVKWTPITPVKWHCLRIESDLFLGGRPFHDRMAYWDLFYKLYGKFEKGVQSSYEKKCDVSPTGGLLYYELY